MTIVLDAGRQPRMSGVYKVKAIYRLTNKQSVEKSDLLYKIYISDMASYYKIDNSKNALLLYNRYFRGHFTISFPI